MPHTTRVVVRPVSLPTPMSVATSTPPADTQPLTFYHLPPSGQLELANPLTTASAEEMREILDVLHGEDTDAQRRAKAAEEAAEKRRKHREAMVLFRLKKKMNFGDMKKQEQSLQDVLQHKLQEYRQLRDRGARSNQQGNARMRELQDEFAEILSLKESLLRENRAMQGVIHELAKFQKLVVDEVERHGAEEQQSSAFEETSSSPRDTSSPMQPGQWVRLRDNEPPIYYVPEPEENHDAMAQNSFQIAHQLRQGFANKRFDYTETFCLGWRAQHSVVNTADGKRMLRFRFTRQVPCWFMKLDDYRRLAWPVVMTPELNARLYSSPVYMKVIQWVNEDTFVTYRNSPHRDRMTIFRYFASNTQVEYRDEQNRRAYMIHHTILDRQPLLETAPDLPIIWIKEGSQCMSFTEIEENDAIEIDHYGYMNCVNEDQARYLMIETCSILMRWEQMVVPPRLLTSD